MEINQNLPLLDRANPKSVADIGYTLLSTPINQFSKNATEARDDYILKLRSGKMPADENWWKAFCQRHSQVIAGHINDQNSNLVMADFKKTVADVITEKGNNLTFQDIDKLFGIEKGGNGVYLSRITDHDAMDKIILESLIASKLESNTIREGDPAFTMDPVLQYTALVLRYRNPLTDAISLKELYFKLRHRTPTFTATDQTRNPQGIDYLKLLAQRPKDTLARRSMEKSAKVAWAKIGINIPANAVLMYVPSESYKKGNPDYSEIIAQVKDSGGYRFIRWQKTDGKQGGEVSVTRQRIIPTDSKYTDGSGKPLIYQTCIVLEQNANRDGTIEISGPDQRPDRSGMTIDFSFAMSHGKTMPIIDGLNRTFQEEVDIFKAGTNLWTDTLQKLMDSTYHENPSHIQIDLNKTAALYANEPVEESSAEKGSDLVPGAPYQSVFLNPIINKIPYK